MFSRAHLLIERDYEDLLKENLKGIDAHPLRSDNLFEWTAKVQGLPGSAWQDGIFRLYIKFDEHYNTRPPEVCFHTIPFHPNIDAITGQPCIDLLDNPDKWNDTCNISHILLAVQRMLSYPSEDYVVNAKALDLLSYSPHTYSQLIQDCVTASQRVEGGLSPHPSLPSKEPSLPPKKENTELSQQQKDPVPLRVGKVSFEDYHTTWSGIATSKNDNNTVNPLLVTLEDRPNLQAVHYGISIEELNTQKDRKANENNELTYGKFRPSDSKPTEDEKKQAKLDQVNKMRKMYLQPRTTPRKTPEIAREITEEALRSPKMKPARTKQNVEEEPWEREVDDLVAWTNNLDEHEII